jgi:hypothetical protein
MVKTTSKLRTIKTSQKPKDKKLYKWQTKKSKPSQIYEIIIRSYDRNIPEIEIEGIAEIKFEERRSFSKSKNKLESKGYIIGTINFKRIAGYTAGQFCIDDDACLPCTCHQK